MGDSLKRVVTGLILIPVVVFIVLYTSTFWVFAATAVLTLLTLLEFNNLSILNIRDRRYDTLGMFCGLSMPAVVYLFGDAAMMPAIMLMLFVFFSFGLWRAAELKHTMTEVTFKSLGIVYLSVPLSYLILMRGLSDGQWWMLFMIIVIWTNDTFAYIIGKAFGAHRMSPVISPKKTVEGAIGGLVFGMAAGVICNYFFALRVRVTEIIVLSLAIGIVGIIGDLAESLLKRAAGVKDSGTIIPGHGGALDRLDSLIFAIPFTYYYILWHAGAPS